MPQFIRIFLSRFKEYIVLALLLILSLILITTNNNQEVKNIRIFALGIFAGVNSFLTETAHFFEDTEYIESLEKRNAELMLENNKLREFGLENRELNGFLNFRNDQSYDLITAKIVSRFVSKISGYFLIAKGKIDGVREGIPVITDNGLVGIVTQIADNYSVVRTFENTLFKVAVKDQRSNVNGILNWDGKNLLVKNIPSNYDVQIGDRIVVSEISTILPPEIPVGYVVEKESTLSGVLTNLKVEPFEKLVQLRNVIVLKVEINNQIDSLANILAGELK